MKQKVIPLESCTVIERLAVIRFGRPYLSVVEGDKTIVYTKYDGQIYREKIHISG